MKHKLRWFFAVILVLGVTAFFVVRFAQDRVTADMLSQAGEFAIPGDWKLVDEIVRPERFMCFSTNPCPSLYPSWDAGKELTDNDIPTVESHLGFNMLADHSCRRPPNAIGDTTICRSRGTDGEYDYLLTVTSPDPGEPQLVTLIVRLAACQTSYSSSPVPPPCSQVPPSFSSSPAAIRSAVGR